MKMLNVLERLQMAGQDAAAAPGFIAAEGFSILLRVLAPIAPHITWQLWRDLGFGQDIFSAPWPEPDAGALEQDEIELVLQVNGKLRGNITVPSAADHAAIEKLALASPVAQKHIAGQAVRKIIVVPGRLVNIVL